MTFSCCNINMHVAMSCGVFQEIAIASKRRKINLKRQTNVVNWESCSHQIINPDRNNIHQLPKNIKKIKESRLHKVRPSFLELLVFQVLFRVFFPDVLFPPVVFLNLPSKIWIKVWHGLKASIVYWSLIENENNKLRKGVALKALNHLRTTKEKKQDFPPYSNCFFACWNSGWMYFAFQIPFDLIYSCYSFPLQSLTTGLKPLKFQNHQRSERMDCRG